MFLVFGLSFLYKFLLAVVVVVCFALFVCLFLFLGVVGLCVFSVFFWGDWDFLNYYYFGGSVSVLFIGRI